MIHVIAGFYMFAGLLALVGSYIYFVESGTFIGPAALAAGGVASLAFGLLLAALGDLLETAKKILAVLEGRSPPAQPGGSGS